MGENGWHTDGGNTNYDIVLDYVLRKGEHKMHIMLDPKSDRYHAIRDHGLEHWKKHYKLIASVILVPEIIIHDC